VANPRPSGAGRRGMVCQVRGLEAEVRKAKRKLRAGVIGTGMGRYHMQGYATHPGSELWAVCDLNVEEAKEFAGKYGAKYVFRNYRDMVAMEELDIVSVAVPNYLHARMTIAALEAGKDVVCEKPMATKLADAEQMVAAAKRGKRRLMIDMSMRFNAVHQELRRRIASGELGDTYYAKTQWIRRKGIPVADFPQTGDMGRGDWFVQKAKSGGGALVDIGVHMLDLVWWLMGAPRPTQVLASTYSELLPGRLAKVGVKGDVDDLATALVKFETGQTVFAEVSWDAHQEPLLAYHILGTKGGATWEKWQQELTIYHDDRRGRPVKTTVKGQGKPLNPYWHFVDCCLDRRAPMLASGEECLNVMRVLDGMSRSQRTGRAIALRS
jgi:predicted dehydrogenase